MIANSQLSIAVKEIDVAKCTAQAGLELLTPEYWAYFIGVCHFNGLFLCVVRSLRNGLPEDVLYLHPYVCGDRRQILMPDNTVCFNII